MLFRKFLASLIIVTSMIAIASCAYVFEEKKPVDEVEFTSEFQCLDQADEVVESYFNDLDRGEDLDQEVSGMVDCYKEALTKFREFTYGGKDSRNEYSTQGISRFLGEVLKNQQFSLSFIEQVLKIKQFLIGGSDTSITKKEIRLLVKIIEKVGQRAAAMRPYRGIYFNKEALTRDQKGLERFDKAFAELELTTSDLMGLIRHTRSKREINIKKSGTFIISEYFDDDEVADKLKYLQLMISFKNVMLNEDGDWLSFGDFKFFLEQTQRTLKTFMEFKHFLKDDNVFDHIGRIATFFTRIPVLLQHGEVFKTRALTSLDRVIERTVESFQYATWRSPSDTLDVIKISNLLIDLEQAEFMGDLLTADTLTRFLNDFVADWLIDSKNTRPELTTDKIAYIKKQFDGWKHRQKFINKLSFDNKGDVESLPEKVKDPTVKPWLDLLGNVNLKTWTKEQRLDFGWEEKPLNYTDLVVANSIFTEAKFFMERFQAPNEKIRNYSVSKDQAQMIYELVRILGLELGFMDGREFDSGERTFSEGNMFTTKSINDDKLDVYETFELLGILYSADTISQQIYKNIPKKHLRGYKDILHKEVIDTPYFREEMEAQYLFYFKQLEGLSGYFRSNPKSHKSFVDTLEKAARDGAVTQRDFSMVEIRIMVTISYYLQSVFYKFDENKDHWIKDSEREKAEEHFLNFLVEEVVRKSKKYKGLSDAKAIDKAREMFQCIVYNKSLPDEGWENVQCSGIYMPWTDLKMDYLGALKIFDALFEKKRRDQIKNIRNFLEKYSREFMGELAALDHQKPDCKLNKGLHFCTFAKLSNCSDAAYDSYLGELIKSRQRFFESKEDPVLVLSRSLNSDTYFSTQCKFPYVEGADLHPEDKKKRGEEQPPGWRPFSF